MFNCHNPIKLDIELDMLTTYHNLKSIPNQSDICLSSLSSGVL